MQKNFKPRYRQGKKTVEESNAYRLSLEHLDKTEPDPVDPNKTNESSIEEEEPLKVTPIKKRSSKLLLFDFLRENLLATLVTGIILAILTGGVTLLFSLNREQGIQGEQINGLESDNARFEKEIQKQNESVDSLNRDLNALDKNFEVFKTEASINLEYRGASSIKR